MNSVWTQTTQLPHFPPLKGDRKTDVLIIGGGMAGILCAWRLSQEGIDCTLVEMNQLCGGVTKNTTAKLTSQHGLIYHQILQMFGAEQARLYLLANEAALEQYQLLCRNIDCDLEEQDSFVYSLTDREKIEKELTALHQIGYDAQFCSELPLPFPVAGAVRFRKQAQFHPLKFVAAIVENLPIYEHTKVLELSPGKAITSGGTISADKIIIATHFPLLNKHGSYFLKLYQHRSYVLALEHSFDCSGMYVDESQTGLSFRNYGNLLLLGGGSHRTGKTGGNWRELEQFARKHCPQAKITARWATQDCMTLDGIPYIGQYSRRTPGLYVATGFNKWGMTSSMAAASLLTDLVQGRKNPYEELFSPSRTMLRPQLAINAAESTLNLLTPTTPRCPHMGCALKYNPAEHSWDCPCHGSRFSEDGKLLDNPATDDKQM